jgi:hypothetical protein
MLHIRRVPGSNLDSESDYLDRSILWASLLFRKILTEDFKLWHNLQLPYLL